MSSAVDLYDAIRKYPQIPVPTRYGQVNMTVSNGEIKLSDAPWSFVINRVRVELGMTLELNGDEWRPVSWSASKRDADWRNNSISKSASDKVRYDVPEDINKWIVENHQALEYAQAEAEKVSIHNRCIHIRIDLSNKEEARDKLNDQIRELRMEYMKLQGHRDFEEPVYAA